jgi:peptidoglycan/LPS O-acetylase OafA/YrhL
MLETIQKAGRVSMSESHGMSKASGIALRNARPDTAQHRSVLAHIPELDGLRAIAVILVMINHYGPVALPFAWRIKAIGWVGVDLFFVLSGFLITRILLETRTHSHYYRDFYVRRTLRIFPLYYCVLLGLFASMLLWNHGERYHDLTEWGSPLWSWMYLGNVQMALLGNTPHIFALIPLWSLHVEEQYYLVFPILVRMLQRQTLLKVLVGMLVLSPLLRQLLSWWAPDNPYISYMLLPCRFDALAIGALIALRPVHLGRRLLGALTIGGGILVYFLFATVGHNLWSDPFTRVWGYSLFPAVFGGVVLWILHYGSSWQTNWLNVAPLQFIGKTSYAIYLLQAPMAGALGTLLAGTALWSNDVCRFALICATTIGLAALSWRVLERPLLQLKERLAPHERVETMGGHPA